VQRFDAGAGRWTGGDFRRGAEIGELTVSTFNVWFESFFAEQRYRAIATLLFRSAPDVMAFQEMTADALTVFCAEPWIRERYCRVAVTGRGVGNYGMLVLSRIPIRRATYLPLPTKMARGVLVAELDVGGRGLPFGSVHLDSGKASAHLRARQLTTAFRAVSDQENAVLVGDYNMRDGENDRIAEPFTDVWPALRPGDPGFTEDTSINLMRFDSKNKHRHVRFDRVLLKGSSWTAADIALIGTEPIAAELPRVFPSDHFGLLCRLVRSDSESSGH
jgi:tyrosyl-DNA phosphodiesterase 2